MVIASPQSTLNLLILSLTDYFGQKPMEKQICIVALQCASPACASKLEILVLQQGMNVCFPSAFLTKTQVLDVRPDGTIQAGIEGGVAKSDGIPKLFPGLGGLAFIYSSLEI